MVKFFVNEKTVFKLEDSGEVSPSFAGGGSACGEEAVVGGLGSDGFHGFFDVD